jgi:UDP-N-acetylmuramate dehydrogenase
MQGAEFLAGIPGSFGGALAMNAGAFGGETWPLARQIETLDRHGVLRQRPPQDFDIGYRHVQGLPGEFFAAAIIALQPATDGHSAERIRRLLDTRKQTQPIGLPSCGSVFRNPPPLWLNGGAQPRYAAQLIEAAGLKGYQIGDAYVSGKHANFIINGGQARAADIECLIQHVQRVVEEKHGVCLVPEVRVVGEA